MINTRSKKIKWAMYRRVGGKETVVHVCDTFHDAMEYLSAAPGKWHGYWTLEEVHKGTCRVGVYAGEEEPDGG